MVRTIWTFLPHFRRCCGVLAFALAAQAFGLSEELQAARTHILGAGRNARLGELSSDIALWNASGEYDEAVNRKAATFLMWEKRWFLRNAMYFHRLKRESAQLLASQPALDAATIRRIARSLDHITNNEGLHHDHDVTEYRHIADVLGAWAAQKPPVVEDTTLPAEALEELLRALGSSEAVKVIEADRVLALNLHRDPHWLAENAEAWQRIDRALSRTWAFELVIKAKARRRQQFAGDRRPPVVVNISDLGAGSVTGDFTAADFEDRLSREPQLSTFMQLIDFMAFAPPFKNQKELAAAVAARIEKLLAENPELAKDFFFAPTMIKAIQRFRLHSPLIDNYLADLITITPKFPSRVVGLGEYFDHGDIADLREAAKTQIAFIHDRHQTAVRLASHSTEPDEQRARGGIYAFSQIDVVDANSTAIDPAALQRILECRSVRNGFKVQLISEEALALPYVQTLLVRMVSDETVGEAALDRLNRSDLNSAQMKELLAILGYSTSYEANEVFPNHDHLRAQFEIEKARPGMLASCLARMGWKGWRNLFNGAAE